MGFNIDLDNDGKLSMAVQKHIIPLWVYANSQINHENKRIYQVNINRRAILEQVDSKKRLRRERAKTSQQQGQVPYYRQYNKNNYELEP